MTSDCEQKTTIGLEYSYYLQEFSDLIHLTRNNLYQGSRFLFGWKLKKPKLYNSAYYLSEE